MVVRLSDVMSKTGKKHKKNNFQSILDLTLNSLAAIQVEPHQCPSHQVAYSPKYQSLKFLRKNIEISHTLWGRMDGTQFSSSQTRHHFLTQTKHYDGHVSEGLARGQKVYVCANKIFRSQKQLKMSIIYPFHFRCSIPHLF